MGEADLGVVCEELIDHCLDLNSRDNMSAVVVQFPGAKLGSGSGLKEKRAERAHIRQLED